jgi:putative spermidine/putrescine transport system substrate-binding protein
MQTIKTIAAGVAALSIAVLSSGVARADGMVFTSWGGTTQDAQKKAWAEPFTAETGVTVKQDGPTDYGKLKAMVESGNVDWDVVDVEGDFAVAAAKAGLLEPLDFSVIKKDDLDPRFVSDHSIGSFYYSFVLGYNKEAFGGKEPATWTDLFDTQKFPGKRTFYKWSAPGVLEIALLADGVTADKLYPLDLDRAFKKLDTIKSDIIWWGGGAQSQQLLASGEAPLGMFWNGRIFAIQADNPNVGLSWEQNLTAADMLVIPKGAKNKAAAMKFLAAASSAQAQDLLDPSIASFLPDQFKSSQINLDMAYWAEHRDEIGKRWYDWQAK